LHRQTPTNEVAATSLVQRFEFGNPPKGFERQGKVLRHFAEALEIRVAEAGYQAER
jgi:hypothetical protein